MAAPSDDPVAASVASSAPWCEDATAVVRRLVTDPERGLSTTEAARRLEEHGPNALEAAEAVPAWRKLLEQFRDRSSTCWWPGWSCRSWRGCSRTPRACPSRSW